MKSLRFVLTIILVTYSVPTILSGLDIYKAAEPDLSSEWIILGIFFLLSLVFYIINLIDLTKVRDK